MTANPLIEALSGIAAVVAEYWPFDSTHYPSLVDASPEEIREFALRHMTLHAMKEAGLLARILEREEHDNLDLLASEKVPSRAKLAMKLIVTGFRLLDASDGNIKDLRDYLIKRRREDSEM